MDRSAAAEVFFRDELHQAHVRRAIDGVWSQLSGSSFVDIDERSASAVGRVIVEYSGGAVMRAFLQRLVAQDYAAVSGWTAGCGLELVPPFSHPWIRRAASRVVGRTTLGSTRWVALRPQIDEAERLIREVRAVHDL